MSFQTRLSSLQEQLLQMAKDPSVTRLTELQGKKLADLLKSANSLVSQAAVDIIAHDTDLKNFNGYTFGEVIEKYNTFLRRFQKTTRSYLAALVASRIPSASSVK